MKNESTVAAMVAEEMVTVSAKAIDTAACEEIKVAKAAKTAEKMAQEIAKLSSAKLDENGMMSIVSYVASDNMTVYYIVETGDKRRRLFDKVAQDLLAKGKATIITPAAFDEMVQTKKDAEKALIGEGITKAAFEIAIKAEEAMANAA